MSLPTSGPHVYKEAVLVTTDGEFVVTVPDHVPIDARRRIVDPAAVFVPNSKVVAFDLHGDETNAAGTTKYGQKLTPEPDPSLPGRDEPPEPYVTKVPRFGLYKVVFEGGGVSLKPAWVLAPLT